METSDDPVRSALASRLGDDAAEALLKRIRSYSNYPNAVKGAAKLDGGPDVAGAALAVVEDPELADALGLGPGAGPYGGPGEEFWALLTLAARADAGVVDRATPHLEGRDYAVRLFAAVRRAAAKHAATAGEPETPAAAEPDVPQKVSEVKAWLAANPDAAPEVLGPRPRQKAGARAAAVRALAALATPEALAVLGRYADDRYPDAVLKELHAAWGRFDRREFAATMFRPGRLDLGLAPTVEGLGAVAGLTDLTVILLDGADLTPLAECADLRTLRVAAENEPGLLGVEPLLGLSELVELHLTRTTRHADLTPLAGLGVQRLRIDLDGADASFLLEMPRLERLLVSDGSPQADTGDLLATLVRRGVQVTIYRHQSAGFPLLVGQAGTPGVVMVDQSGYLGFTDDAAATDEVRRRLYANLVP